MDSTTPRLLLPPWVHGKQLQQPAPGVLRWHGQGWAVGPQPSAAFVQGTLTLPHLTEGRLAEGPRVPEQRPRGLTHLGLRDEDL